MTTEKFSLQLRSHRGFYDSSLRNDHTKEKEIKVSIHFIYEKGTERRSKKKHNHNQQKKVLGQFALLIRFPSIRKLCFSTS